MCRCKEYKIYKNTRMQDTSWHLCAPSYLLIIIEPEIIDFCQVSFQTILLWWQNILVLSNSDENPQNLLDFQIPNYLPQTMIHVCLCVAFHDLQESRDEAWEVLSSTGHTSQQEAPRRGRRKGLREGRCTTILHKNKTSSGSLCYLHLLKGNIIYLTFFKNW